MTSSDPFIPRILRSEQGTVAIQVDPSWFPGSTQPHYRLAHLGPDGIELMEGMRMPMRPGAVVSDALLRRYNNAPFHELVPGHDVG